MDRLVVPIAKYRRVGAATDCTCRVASAKPARFVPFTRSGCPSHGLCEWTIRNSHTGIGAGGWDELYFVTCANLAASSLSKSTHADAQQGHPGPIVAVVATGVPSLLFASNEAAAAAAPGF